MLYNLINTVMEDQELRIVLSEIKNDEHTDPKNKQCEKSLRQKKKTNKQTMSKIFEDGDRLTHNLFE